MIDIIVKLDHSEAALFLGCVGYEARSTYILENDRQVLHAKKMLFDYRAIDSAGNTIGSYASNLKAVERHSAHLEPSFEKYLVRIGAVLIEQRSTSIAIDITSFDRKKIAMIIVKLFQLRQYISSIQLIYAPRIFQPFDMFKFDVVQSFGPVIPEFFGSAEGIEKPLTLVLGAGYEYGKAVGAIDTLEPDHIYCFRPTGTNPEFDKHIDIANVDFEFIENKENIFFYDLTDPASLYHDLRSLVDLEKASQNVLLLPLGPKLFAAITVVIGTILHPKIIVWRHSTVSTAQPQSIVDAQATGKLIKFSFEFTS